MGVPQKAVLGPILFIKLGQVIEDFALYLVFDSWCVYRFSTYIFKLSRSQLSKLRSI